MDNSTSPTNGLDLNPDMMTTQTGVPTVAAPPSTMPPVPAGVIDITPGAPQVDVSPSTQHIDSASLPEPTISHLAPTDTTDGLAHLGDITPAAPESTIPPVNVSSPAITPQPISLTNEVKANDVIDITPDQTTEQSDGLTHLSDIAPQTSPATPAPTTLPNVPLETQAASTTPPVVPGEQSTAPVIPIVPVTSSPAAPSPLAEDPDLVKLVK